MDTAGIQERLEPPDKYSVIIIPASDNNDKAIALSVWDMPIATAAEGSGKKSMDAEPMKRYCSEIMADLLTPRSRRPR